jgi:hypothetical protein
MVSAPQFTDLDELMNGLDELLNDRTKRRLKEQNPCSINDVQKQIEATIHLIEESRSHKESGDYWLATAELVENLRYYRFVGELGKCGYVLLEVADCLFCADQFGISIACCVEAVPLLIRSRDHYDWARGMAAVGELLLAALILTLYGPHEAAVSLRKLRLVLTLKERRVLSNEDAHRIIRRLIAAHKSRNLEPLQELGRIAPSRKRTEHENLHSFLDEWMNHYAVLRRAVDMISSTEKSKGNRRYENKE